MHRWNASGGVFCIHGVYLRKKLLYKYIKFWYFCQYRELWLRKCPEYMLKLMQYKLENEQKKEGNQV